jgi:hypothetical protein
MANELLDFVMSVVDNPDVAAVYADDAAFDAFGDLPAQVIGDVHDLGGPVIDHVASQPDAAPADGPLLDDAVLDHSAFGDLIEVPETGLDFAADEVPYGLVGPDQFDPQASGLDIFD